MRNKIAIITLTAALLAVAFWLGVRYGSSTVQRSITGGNQPAALRMLTTLSCDDNKSIWAAFKENGVDLSLSDGRDIDLPLAASAPTAIYSNSDSSIEFIEREGGGYALMENGEAVYENCKE